MPQQYKQEPKQRAPADYFPSGGLLPSVKKGGNRKTPEAKEPKISHRDPPRQRGIPRTNRTPKSPTGLSDFEQGKTSRSRPSGYRPTPPAHSNFKGASDTESSGRQSRNRRVGKFRQDSFQAQSPLRHLNFPQKSRSSKEEPVKVQLKGIEAVKPTVLDFGV